MTPLNNKAPLQNAYVKLDIPKLGGATIDCFQRGSLWAMLFIFNHPHFGIVAINFSTVTVLVTVKGDKMIINLSSSQKV